MSTERTLRGGENLHILFWLLKDLCWVSDLRIAGLALVVPSVWLAHWVCWRSGGQRRDLFDSADVVRCILANST
jgi:hypothetical protein